MPFGASPWRVCADTHACGGTSTLLAAGMLPAAKRGKPAHTHEGTVELGEALTPERLVPLIQDGPPPAGVHLLPRHRERQEARGDDHMPGRSRPEGRLVRLGRSMRRGRKTVSRDWSQKRQSTAHSLHPSWDRLDTGLGA